MPTQTARATAPDIAEPGVTLPPSSLSDAQRAEIGAALLETFFAGRDAQFLDSDWGKKAQEDHIWLRFERFQRHVIPWIERVFDLRSKTILEYGCGTGSISAALAGRCEHLYGYDMSDKSVEAARRRLEILELSHAATLTCEAPEKLLERIKADHPEGVDAFVLYAVLEHQKLDERLATLTAAWELLRPGGILLISDTPNRLSYLHYHTSEVPFYDCLPDELALRYASRSPRPGFRDGMAKANAVSHEHAVDVLDRWGRGVSFHEFEEAIGPLDSLVVADGYQPEILHWKQPTLAEQLLLTFFVEGELSLPVAFSRLSLDLILQKPGGAHPAPLLSSQPDRTKAIESNLRRIVPAPGTSPQGHGTEETAEHSASVDQLKRENAALRQELRGMRELLQRMAETESSPR